MQQEIMTTGGEKNVPEAEEEKARQAEDLKSSQTDVRMEVKTGEAHTQQNNAQVRDQYNNFFPPGGAAPPRPLEDLPGELASLPPKIHPFRDPRHGELLSELERERILVLTSYQERAAYSAAFSLAHDEPFHRQTKKALFPTRRRDKERLDLDLWALADDQLLGKDPQILLIEIDLWCALFDSMLSLTWGTVARVRARLEDHSSYLILAVDEALWADEIA